MKLLLLLAPLLSACAAFDADQPGTQISAGSDAVVRYNLKPQASCNVGDRTDWRGTPKLQEPTYLWIVLDPTSFEANCNPRGYRDADGKGIVACAVRFPSGANRIYATAPRYLQTESLVQHEEAHLLGCEHDTPEQMRMSPTR